MKEVLALSILIIGLVLVTFFLNRKKSKRIGIGGALTLGSIFMLAAFGVVSYDSIHRLNLQAKATKFEFERFRENVDSVAQEAFTELQNKITEQKTELEHISEEANLTKQQIQKIHQDSADLAQLLTKITWLQVVTKGEFGGKRDMAARKKITEELDQILIKVIPDVQKRDKWIEDMFNLLPE